MLEATDEHLRNDIELNENLADIVARIRGTGSNVPAAGLPSASQYEAVPVLFSVALHSNNAPVPDQGEATIGPVNTGEEVDQDPLTSLSITPPNEE